MNKRTRTVRRHPPAVIAQAPEIHLRRLFFAALALLVHFFGTHPRGALADHFTQSLQPPTCPHEFNCQNRQPQGYYDQRRTRRNQHDYAQQHYAAANERDHYSTCGCIRNMESTTNHRPDNTSIRFRLWINAGQRIPRYVARHPLQPHCCSWFRSGSRRRDQRRGRCVFQNSFAGARAMFRKPSPSPL